MWRVGRGCVLYPLELPAGMKADHLGGLCFGVPIPGLPWGYLRQPVSLASQPSRETQTEWQLGPRAGTRLTRGTTEWLDVAASGCGRLGPVRCPCGLLSVREGGAQADVTIH